MAKRMKDMESELREVKSRSVSPVQTPRRGGGTSGFRGTGQAPSPAGSSVAGPLVDDWQLVLGGYADAKREEIQAEVRALFEEAEASPLLKNIITPFVRSNICRMELLYLDEGFGARRGVQQAVIVALRKAIDARGKKSTIMGQERASLWVSRNRGPEERNRNRALLGLRDLGLAHLPPQLVDLDWKGRLWYNGTQVLYHVDRDDPTDDALMFLSTRGDESGWWVSLRRVSSLLQVSEDEEVGGFSHLQVGQTITLDLFIGDSEYVVYVHNTTKAHLATAVAVQSAMEPSAPKFTSLSAGFLVELFLGSSHFLLGSLHLPYEQRNDATEVWLDSLESFTVVLSSLSPCCTVFVGADLNQPLYVEVDNFPAVAQLRLMAARFMLRFSDDVGDTWHARGLSAPIDFILFRHQGMLGHTTKREDLRLALPSDHDMVQAWATQFASLPQAHTAEDLSSVFAKVRFRQASLRYRDSEEIKELIRQRKVAQDPVLRAALALEIAQQRCLDQESHRKSILERARSGDFAAISYLRRSASQTKVAGSYIQSRGGLETATEELRDFYNRKYDAAGTGADLGKIEAVRALHEEAPWVPFTLKELVEATSKIKRGTSSGEDGVPYEALYAYAVSDHGTKLLHLFNRFLSGDLPLPASWREGNIVLLPKTPQPKGPADLRPIALTSCMAKVYPRLLLARLESRFPPFDAGQFGARKGVQTIDGVAAAHMTMRLAVSRYKSRPVIAKLDVKAAFDSLSFDAILEFLRHTQPSREAWLLWDLCSSCSVNMRLGSRAWSVPLKQGLPQGTAYSAVLFGRVLDWFLGPLIRTWEQRWPDWRLPFLLLYADDVLLLAPSAARLQQMTQEVVDLLSTLNLRVNAAKCSVLDTEEGVGHGIFLRGHCAPLKTEASLLYLGVPLQFDFSPMTCFGRALGRCSNTFFAMRNLFNSRLLPAVKKIQLFDLYVTSRWLWCSGLIWPTKVSLRSLTSHQTTLLLGLLGFRADFFGEFLHNVVAKRRAVRCVLHTLQLETWDQKWLKQVWRYWGHAARNSVSTPLKFLMHEYGNIGLMAGRSLPGWVSKIIPSKLQLVFAELREACHPALWESAALNRPLWQKLLEPWCKHWGTGPPSTDLLGRQLLIIDKAEAVLRPFRFFPEEAYTCSVCNIQGTKILPSGPLLWCSISSTGVSVVVVPSSRSAASALVVQEQHPVGSESTLSRALHLWNLIGLIHRISGVHMDVRLVVPSECVTSSLLSGDVTLATKAWHASFENQERCFDLLSRTVVWKGKDLCKLPAFLRSLPATQGVDQCVDSDSDSEDSECRTPRARESDPAYLRHHLATLTADRRDRPIEAKAFHLLRRGEPPCKSDILTLFDLLPRSTLKRSPSGRYVVLGASPRSRDDLVTFSHCMPLFTLAVNRFLRAHAPTARYSTLVLREGCASAPHRDIRNGPTNACIFGLSTRGAEDGLWVQHADGTGFLNRSAHLYQHSWFTARGALSYQLDRKGQI
ncbi:pol [Symbiodinium sp. CCMP2592]|nr:pol [Symbiodinium sp. CCMP2592]